MSSPNHITIKLEIDIPAGCGTPVVQCQYGTQHRLRDTIRICPIDNASNHPVKPGLMGPKGTICSWAKFGDNPPNEVRAQVVPAATTSLGTAPNMADTDAGVSNPSRTKWSWSDLNSPANPVRGAGHAAAPNGVANNFVIWSRHTGDTIWSSEFHPFVGVTGTNDPCGAPLGDPCREGSGSGSTPPIPIGTTKAKPDTYSYPSVWMASITGFGAGPLAVFNVSFALRLAEGTTAPTWDNHGDGKASPSVKLVLCPKNGWELTLRFKDAIVPYVVPYDGDIFGPILFPARKDKVQGIGDVHLPPIHVSTI